MKKWLLMAILCLSVAGCDWFRSDNPDGETNDAAPTDPGADNDATDDGASDAEADGDTDTAKDEDDS